MKKHECAHCDHKITTSNTMPVESIGPCSCCGKDDWREVNERTWECNGCDDGPCHINKATRPVLCIVSGDPIVLQDAWSEVKPEPLMNDSEQIPEIKVSQDLNGKVTVTHQSGCPVRIRYDLRYDGEVNPEPEFRGVGYESPSPTDAELWPTKDDEPFRVRITKPGHDPCWYSGMVGRVLIVIPYSESCYRAIVDSVLSRDPLIFHRDCERVLPDAVDTCPGCTARHKKLLSVIGINHDTCPGCIAKKEEIERLKRLDESRLVDIAGIEADLGRAYDNTEKREAEIVVLKERITSLKCSLSDVATELDSRIKGLESDLRIERKKVEQLKAELTARCENQVTLSLTMEGEKIDTFLKAFPGFEPKGPK